MELKELEVGAGNFSFTPSRVTKLLSKKRDVPEITCTTLASEEEAKSDKLTKIGLDRIKYANLRPGVHIKTLFSIDATKLSQYQQDQTLEKRYNIIRFNMPNDRSAFAAGSMRKLIRDFFISASALQKPGDKIYITIPKKAGSFFYHAYFGLYDASVEANYVLYRKRKFISAEDRFIRYPGYIHMKTDSPDYVEAANNVREYVFVKLNRSLNADDIRKSHPPVRPYIYGSIYNCYNDPETDTESDEEDFSYTPKEISSLETTQDIDSCPPLSQASYDNETTQNQKETNYKNTICDHVAKKCRV